MSVVEEAAEKGGLSGQKELWLPRSWLKAFVEKNEKN